MSAPAAVPKLWSVERLARHWDTRPDTIRAMVRRGQLKAVKLGRLVKFRESDLIAYLEKRRPA